MSSDDPQSSQRLGSRPRVAAQGRIARLRRKIGRLYRVLLPGILETLARRMRSDQRMPAGAMLQALHRRLTPGLAQGQARGGLQGLPPLRPSSAVLVAARNAIATFAPTEPDLACIEGPALEALPARPGPLSPRMQAWLRLQPALEAPVSRMILLPSLCRGAAARVAINALRAADAKGGAGSTLLVVTDATRLEAAALLPEPGRVVMLAAPDLDLRAEDRIVLLVALVQRLRPKAVLNVSSRAGWDLVLRHGRPLSALTRLSAYVLSEEYDAQGHRVDHAYLDLRNALPHLAAVHCDHAGLLADFAAAHALPPEQRAKLRPVPQPVPALRFPSQREGGIRRVLWAGRLTWQRAPDLLRAIAAAAPEITFEVHGSGTRAEVRAALRGAPSNIVSHGAFSDLAALPAEAYGALLYTARWDGLPGLLLEAGAAGLPIVASEVGGIGSLLTAETGWPVAAIEDPSAYVAALRALLTDHQAAKARAACLHRRIVEQHNIETHAAALGGAPGFLWDDKA